MISYIPSHQAIHMKEDTKQVITLYQLMFSLNALTVLLTDTTPGDAT